MMKTFFKQIILITNVIIFSFFNTLAAKDSTIIDNIHFLIPGGAGGGWDGTARGIGEALTKSGLINTASYENMSGGGGGKAIGYLIENAKSHYNTLMINSTPIVVRSLTGLFPYNFRDLTVVSSVIGDYSVIAVQKDSPIKSIKDFIKTFKKDPEGTPIGGGSTPGSADHLVAAMIIEASGQDPLRLRYVPYDAGGKAMAALLSGEIKALSTGFSEAITLALSGEVRIIGITADKPVDDYKNIPTLKEQGFNVTFVNWRGLFAAPGLPANKLNLYKQVINKMYKTPEWEKIRKRNGWVNIHHPGDEFLKFLEKQEKEIKSLMKKLGFL